MHLGGTKTIGRDYNFGYILNIKFILMVQPSTQFTGIAEIKTFSRKIFLAFEKNFVAEIFKIHSRNKYNLNTILCGRVRMII